MPLLTVRELSIRFGGIIALDGVSFEVEPGQIVGLIGPNGAGKTTIFNCMTRVYDPDRGSIVFGGKELLRLQRHQVIGAGAARTFQNLELFGSMTVLENLLVGQHSSTRSGLLDCAFRLPRSLAEERRIRERAAEIIDFLGLQRYTSAPAGSLPFGVKKRVELARALVSSPRMVLLDEPANGLNHEETGALADLIFALRDDLKLTILLVEHHMGLVMKVSDTVCVLNFGKKIAEGSPAEVQKNPAVIEAYLGTPVA